MDAVLPFGRERLVRLCATLSGSPDAAEDLAQETMIKAWRHGGQLREPAARSSWLAGIARNACRRRALERWSPDRPLPEGTAHSSGVRLLCRACGAESSASLWHLLLDTPQVQRFWQRYPPLRPLAVREIERDGTPAVVSGFASVDSTASVEIVSAAGTFDILHVEGLPER
jgi:hypothetical protein